MIPELVDADMFNEHLARYRFAKHFLRRAHGPAQERPRHLLWVRVLSHLPRHAAWQGQAPAGLSMTPLRAGLVFLGSGFGGVVRYLFGGWVLALAGPGFPYGTVSINALGSFCIALIMTISLSTQRISPDLRLLLTTGVMGGFTTYSTFNYESIALFQQGAQLLAVLNIVVTVLVCLFMGACGVWLARLWVGV